MIIVSLNGLCDKKEYRPSDQKIDVTVELFEEDSRSDVKRTSREQGTCVVFLLIYFLSLLQEIVFTAYQTT